MKIATYNLRFGGGKKNREHWKGIFEFVQPDIFLVQETCDPKLYLDEDFYESSKERIVWQSVEGRPWGSALYFSRGVVQPITIPGFGGWVVGAEVTGFGYACDDSLLRVFSIHAPRPQKSSYLKEVNKILDFILENYDDGDAELVIGGDFNLGVSVRSSEQPHFWDPEDWRTRMKRELRLINCWQAANPNCELPQTLRWNREPDYPYHCDGIFVPAYWYPYLEFSQVLVEGWEGMSDHNPVIAIFEEDAPEDLEASEDEIPEDLENCVPLPELSVEQYKEALIAIKDNLTAGQWAMLEAHYLAPKQTITATQLADAADYQSYRGANLQYAKVGQKIANYLNYEPIKHSGSGQPFWSSVLAGGNWALALGEEGGSDSTWYWMMWEELSQALEALGWV